MLNTCRSVVETETGVCTVYVEMSVPLGLDDIDGLKEAGV